jgi:hypothetical protein
MTWVRTDTSWHRTEVAYCEVTGQLLAPRHWEFEDAGRVIRARDEHCEEIYWRFVAGREGRAAPAEGAQR